MKRGDLEIDRLCAVTRRLRPYLLKGSLHAFNELCCLVVHAYDFAYHFDGRIYAIDIIRCAYDDFYARLFKSRDLLRCLIHGAHKHYLRIESNYLLNIRFTA